MAICANSRGRPAGFYELLSGEPVVGQVVQRLTNRLDAGEVLAFAETKARPHSYRATMEDAYRTSPLLLPQAVQTLLAGKHLDMVPAEHVTTLPAPMTVARFVLQRFAALVRRLGYGLAIEKRGAWHSPRMHIRNLKQWASYRDARPGLHCPCLTAIAS